MCNFCNLDQAKKSILTTEFFFVIFDRAMVTEGHALIVLKRHAPSILDLNQADWFDLRTAVHKSMKRLGAQFHTDSYNFGINEGAAAGQTVPHFHMHVFPRRAGDVKDPRGGIRNFVTPLQQLWPSEPQ